MQCEAAYEKGRLGTLCLFSVEKETVLLDNLSTLPVIHLSLVLKSGIYAPFSVVFYSSHVRLNDLSILHSVSNNGIYHHSGQW